MMLPPKIWDNPRTEDLKVYEEFVAAYTSSEEQYLEYYRLYLEEDDKDVNLRALAYSCVYQGTNSKIGRHVAVQVDNNDDDGFWWGNTHTFDAAKTWWGTEYVLATAPNISLPPSENIVDLQDGDQTSFNPADPVLRAQDVGTHRIHAWFVFRTVEVPNSARINYAYVELVAKGKSWSGPDTVEALIGAESTNTSEVNNCNPCQSRLCIEDINEQQTNSRVLWTHSTSDWTSGQSYDTTNIACVVQSIVNQPSWQSGSCMTVIFQGRSQDDFYGYLEAMEAFEGDDTNHGPILHIYYASDFDETSTGGGVIVGGSIDSSEELWIGKQPIGTQGLFDGQVDDVRVYKRPLDPAEVKALYNAQTRWELWDEPERVVVVYHADLPCSGGVELNGSATVSLIRASGTSGGVVLNSRARLGDYIAVRGGVKLNSTAINTVYDYHVASGGVVLNSTAVNTVYDYHVASGGVVLNSTAVNTVYDYEVGGGGIKLNSTAINTVYDYHVASGGVVLDGTSYYPFNEIVEVGGGIVLDGRAVTSDYITVRGGIVLDSIAPVYAIYNITVQTHIELAVNGEFVYDISGWTNHATNGWDTAEWSAGAMHLVNDGTPTYPGIYQTSPVTLVVGAKYRIVVNRTGSCYVKLGLSSNPGSGSAGYDSYTSGNLDTTFTATASTAYLMFVGSTGAADVTIQNISLQKTIIVVDGTATITSSDTVEVSGGVVINGTAINTVYDYHVASGGVVIDSTASRTFFDYFDASGGVELNSQANTGHYITVGGGVELDGQANTGHYIPVRGGVVVNSSATTAFRYNITPTGGVVANGTARQTFIDYFYPSGGVVIDGNGAISETGIFDEFMSGGVVVNGTAGQTFIDYFDASGGVVLNSRARLGDYIAVRGGVKLNSTAINTVYDYHVASGGVVLNSTAVNTVYDYHVASGGVVLNSTAANTIYDYHVASGGVVINSTAINTVYDYHVASGGVVLDGTSYYPFSDIIEVGGGVKLNGQANTSNYIVVGGGVELNSSAATAFTYNITPAGGVKLNSQANTGHYITVRGGVVLDGAAAQPAVYNVATSGGVVCDGIARQTFIDYFDASGGIKLNSQANTGHYIVVGGGVEIDGQTSPTVIYNPVASGGVKLNSQANTGYYITVRGGVVLDGAANQPSVYNVTPSGGTKLNSTANTIVVYNVASSGGIKLNSTATTTGSTIIQVGGGVVANSACRVNAIYNPTTVINLIDNGYGEDGNDTNFSFWTFDGSDKYQGTGSFLYTSTGSGSSVADTYITVDSNRRYDVSIWAKQGDIGGGNYDPNAKQLIGYACYDADYNIITPYNVMRYSGATDTTLAAELKNGDSTVLLTNATGWCNSGQTYEKHMGWWPYTNSYGETYPDYTYTRNISPNYGAYASGMWANGGISGNTITLAAPWPGPTLPAGTPVRNITSGGTYNYCYTNFSSYIVVPQTWTHYEGYLQGPPQNPWNNGAYFRYGTRYIKFWSQMNYQGTTPNSIRYNMLEMLLQLAPSGVMGGTTGASATYSTSFQGGTVCNGTADVSVKYSAITNGGAVVDGMAGVQMNIPIGGGVVVNSSAKVATIYDPLYWLIDIIPIPMLPDVKNRKPGCQPNIMSNQFKGLVAWWMNGEQGGTNVYDPVGGNTGTTNASNWIQNGERGNHVLQLDGSTDYVDCGNGRQLSMFGNDMTASIWVNPTSYPASNYDVILSKQSDYEIALDSSGHACYRLAHSWGSWTDTGRVVSQNTWTLITLVVKNGTATLYLNGRSS